VSDELLELRDVTGPSALGGGWRRSLELLYLIAVTEFKKTYFGTALGYLWSVGRPLMLFAVLLTVFTQAFHLGTQVPHYAVLLLLNIVLMGFFQEAPSGAVGSIVERSVPALVAQPGQLRVSLLGMSFLNRLESWEVRSDRLRLRGQ